MNHPTVDMPAASAPAAAAAARLTWIGLPGTEVDEETARLLAAGAGGVVLFSANISGLDQLMALTAELRRHAARSLPIAIDHEGGHIVRVGAPLTRFPSAMAIGATRDEELAYQVARAAGEELLVLGIDVNFAPVLDVALDPRNASVGVRSFGSSPELVARLGAATVRGYQDAGIAATAKHFPGHGRTPVDSHLALPLVAGGREALRANDLPPFQSAIEAGVALMMVSHVAYEGLTHGLPSTLSGRIIGDLLRDELGFAGLVITDAMRMRALADSHAVPAACVQAVAAGADVVLPLDQQADTLAALAEAIRAGELPASRVDEALTRRRRLDARLAAGRPPATPDPASVLPNDDHVELASEVARRSLTLVRGQELLPLAESTAVAVVEFASRRPSLVEEAIAGSRTLGASLERRLPRLREVVVDAAADVPAAEQAALEAASTAEFVILATRDAYLWPEEQALIARILDGGRPTMLVALRNPYDVAAIPGITGAVAAYADVPATFEALADALTGHAGWPGHLPMSLDLPVAA